VTIRKDGHCGLRARGIREDSVPATRFHHKQPPYWKRRTLRAHRYRLELQKPHLVDAFEQLPPLPDDDDLIPSSVVKRENGNICDMTLWRWMHPGRSKTSLKEMESRTQR
jgi:hypothetical protein